MKRFLNITLSALVVLAATSTAHAGNPDRAGQAGATQLLINGWSKSSGWGWAGVSSITGVESMFMNSAGLAKSSPTEVQFSRTNWLRGSDININSFGISQQVNTDGYIGLSVMSFDVGAIDITTVDQPDGGLGTFKPQFMNIGLGYGKKFSEAISVGILGRIVSEAINDVKAQGIALDAGVQYVATADENNQVKKNDVHFGISVKNIGADMQYTGDGLSVKTLNRLTGDEGTTQQRSNSFNMPSLINIGAGYDFRLDGDSSTYFHKLALAGNFTSHTFQNNEITVGLEYSYKSLFQIRTAYAYQDGIGSYETRNTAFTGFSGGLSVNIPLSDDDEASTLSIDYSYRSTQPFNGTHSFGVRLNLR